MGMEAALGGDANPCCPSPRGGSLVAQLARLAGPYRSLSGNSNGPKGGEGAGAAGASKIRTLSGTSEEDVDMPNRGFATPPFGESISCLRTTKLRRESRLGRAGPGVSNGRVRLRAANCRAPNARAVRSAARPGSLRQRRR